MQCATTNCPMHHTWHMHCRLATPGLGLWLKGFLCPMVPNFSFNQPFIIARKFAYANDLAFVILFWRLKGLGKKLSQDILHFQDISSRVGD